jgi:methylglutaconyl-CoA hydratase
VSAVLLERRDAVATLTLNRPEVRNALSPELSAELTAVLGEVALDDSRVVVLTGAGSAFCAGADIASMRAARDMTQADNVADAAALQAMLEALDTCPKPVVARVNGPAFGGGAGLVACADVAVCASGVTFAFSEVRLGIVPAVISPYVLRAVGPGHTRALFTTGARFDAAEAHRIGLVHRLAEPDGLDQAVGAAVAEFLACGPAAIAAAKRLLREATGGLAADDLPQRIAALRASPEAQEGLTAFLERRRPAWDRRSGES